MRRWSSLLGTALVASIYLAIIAGVLLTDQLTPVPKSNNQRALNLTQAWADLHAIATGPHPYNSHANDRVHAFLLSQLKSVTAAFPGHVHLVDDQVSNGTWGNTYFEGTNVLLKIDGTDGGAKEGAVLFSAHYDSVSTSTGTTDNGIAVVALLQLVQKYARTRPRRTAVFNFDNGEEDGLNGAHAFLQHLWSNLTSTFLNLEGAASGGRPLLFRSTSPAPLPSYLPPNVPHPHTNVLAANAFARGLIRSQTDYVVYADKMQGLDIAFYKGRSRYHTRYDAVPWLEGGERALWAMMETADGAGWALLNRDEGSEGKGKGDSVYFDLFGRTVVLFSLTALRTFDVMFLITAPIFVLLLNISLRLATTRSSSRGQGLVHRLWHAHPNHGLEWLRFWVSLLVTVAAQAGLIWVHARFNPYIIYSSPYLVLLSALSLAYITFTIPFLHPYLNPDKQTQPAPSLLPLLILTYVLLLGTTLLTLDVPLGGTYPLSTLAGCVFAGWLIGVVGELLLLPHNVNIGSENAEEHSEEQRERRLVRGIRYEVPDEVEAGASVNGLGVGAGETDSRPSQQGRREGEIEEGEVETEPTEITPLIAQHRRSSRDERAPAQSSTRTQIVTQYLLSLLQLILVVPLPVVLFAHVGVMVVGSMGQGVADGGKGGVLLVYTVFSLFAVFFLLPVVPFLHSASSPSPSPPESSSSDSQHHHSPHKPRNHYPLLPAVLVTFILSTLYTSSLLGLLLTPLSPPPSRLGFPFSVDAPLKVYFEQRVQVLGGWSHGAHNISADTGVGAQAVATTILRGVPYYLERMVVPALPSAVRAAAGEGEGGEAGVQCVDDDDKVGLRRCWWGSGDRMVPEPGFEGGWDLSLGSGSGAEVQPNTTYLLGNAWLRSSITRLGEGKVRIRLRGRNSRGCRVYFDSPSSTSTSSSSSSSSTKAKVRKWRVLHGSGEGVGIDLVKLWSRTWGREFVLDVEFDSGDGDAGAGASGRLHGRVACGWVEYASGMAGNEGDVRERMQSETGSRIPAYEEALKFFPRWAVPTQVRGGLVEVWAKFEV